MGYTQDERKLSLATPLGKDVLLFKGLTGEEGLSKLFEFEVLALAENKTKISFDALLGQKVTVKMKMGLDETPCFLNGLCHRVRQGGRDDTFTTYRVGMVPDVWKLSKKARSRIFQQKTVPEILKKVLEGFEVSWELTASYEPRDFCVQYRESDLNFMCRLMEEEGIWFCFKHEDGSHTMVVGDSATVHPDVPGEKKVKYEEIAGGVRDEERIYSWEKTQEMRSGKVTLWDHHFELPHKHLEAEEPIIANATAGTVTHKLRVGGNEELELYDWPGEYAQRYDGVEPSGGEQPAEVQKVFKDNERTATLRMDEETFPGLVARGQTNARHLRSGHAFELDKHFNANGGWVVLEAMYEALQTADYRSGNDELQFAASFTCIPEGVRFRPPRTTAKPIIAGTQSAVVVGPKGEEIFTDKYGRVKVQFHWDRDGKNDQKSSCWIRVAQLLAGRRWGASFWPRIGQEVVVAFEEGDPDSPIIVGVVYNLDQMPPYLGQGPDPKHRNDNKLMGVKSNTTLDGVGYNEWRFDDTKGKEQVYLHAEKDLDVRVKATSRTSIGGDAHVTVGGEKDGKRTGDLKGLVYRDTSFHTKKNLEALVGGDMKLTIGGEDGPGAVDLVVKDGRKTLVEKDDQVHVKGDLKDKVGGNKSVTVGGNLDEKVALKAALEAGQEIHLKSGMTIVIEAGVQLSLKGPGGFIDISPVGVTIQGNLVNINSGGAAGAGSGSSPASPAAAAAAAPPDPAVADTAKTGQKSS
jgi:type VI secretion system secreted protein VgrG